MWKPTITENSNRTLYICCHCEESLGFVKKQYCTQCSTKKGRDEVDTNNKEIQKLWHGNQ